MPRWEYATLTVQSDQEKLRVFYSCAQDCAISEDPYQAVDSIIGELGGKDWELVSVTDIVRHNYYREKNYYFKRPHHPARGLED